MFDSYEPYSDITVGGQAIAHIIRTSDGGFKIRPIGFYIGPLEHVVLSHESEAIEITKLFWDMHTRALAAEAALELAIRPPGFTPVKPGAPPIEDIHKPL